MSARCAVVLGSGAGEVRRRVGPTAWCALEVLAASATRGRGGDGLRVDASVRSVAVELGVSKNAAHRAMLALRRSGLIISTQRRAGDGRFDAGTYAIADTTGIVEPLPASGREPQPRLRPRTNSPPSSGRAARAAPFRVGSPCSRSQVPQQHVQVSSDKCPRVGGCWVGRCCG